MISNHESLILNIIRHHLLHKILPSNINGCAGRACETMLENIGICINRGSGCDIPEIGWEVKSRKGTATSAQTITAMHPDNVISTSYYDSPVYKKIKKQLRFTTNEFDIVVAIDLCDFDQPQIQDLLEEAYEHARMLITQTPTISYTPYENFWGYFEKTKKHRPELDFRLADGQMEKLLAMTSSNFQNLYLYDC